MGNSVSRWWKTQTSSVEPVKLLLLGLDASGKTSILYKLSGGKVNTTIPTIGFNIETLNMHGCIFTAWDVGGRDKIRALWRHYFERTIGIIFCVDSNDMDRMDQARDELRRLFTEEHLQGVPLLLLCNKQDLPNAMPPSKIVEILGLTNKTTKDTINNRHWHAFPCSATKGYGVDDGLRWLVKTIHGEQDKAELAQTSSTEATNDEDDTTVISGSSLSVSDVLGYGPMYDNTTLDHFGPIQRGTECPFAKSAKLWGGILDGSSLEEQALANVFPLRAFVEKAKSDGLDGYCVELTDPLARSSPQGLGECVRRFLTTLSDEDPETIMRVNYIGRRGWRFRFAGADFFITSFSSCYPYTSSRYAFGTGRAFLLLQPETSFLRHNLPFDTHITNVPAKTVRDKTRLAFEKAGRSYFVPNTTKYPPAEHIVKPLVDDGHSVIKWWSVVSQ